jgi:DNA-binding CsgD family transcriptional regulator
MALKGLVAISCGNKNFSMRVDGIHSRNGRAREAHCGQHGKVMSQNALQQTSNTEDFSLTRMELIGLTLVANGYRAGEISARLGVSEKETETLLFCAERKLGARNRLHAVAMAAGQGLIGIEV